MQGVAKLHIYLAMECTFTVFILFPVIPFPVILFIPSNHIPNNPIPSTINLPVLKLQHLLL